MTNRYFVSIDNDTRDIHVITVIYASTPENAREIVTAKVPNSSIIGIYETFPALLIEDGVNYVCYAWKPLQCALMVARQREKVITLQNELERERATLANLERILREKKEEAKAIPQF